MTDNSTSPRNLQGIPIPTRKGPGKLIYIGRHHVGSVSGNVYQKTVHASRHFLRQRPGIANDIDALAQAEALGAVFVLITDADTQTNYLALIKTIREQGYPINFVGPQLALDLRYWQTLKESPKQEAEAVPAGQLSMGI